MDFHLGEGVWPMGTESKDPKSWENTAFSTFPHQDKTIAFCLMTTQDSHKPAIILATSHVTGWFVNHTLQNIAFYTVSFLYFCCLGCISLSFLKFLLKLHHLGLEKLLLVYLFTIYLLPFISEKICRSLLV